MPHDVKCSCEECLTQSADDSLRFSLSRINAYKALSSPSLIALSSKDPVLTAFQLSNELKRLAVMESQFKEEYKNLRKKVQEFAVGLVDCARTSYELEVCLNHNPGSIPWQPGTLINIVIQSCFWISLNSKSCFYDSRYPSNFKEASISN